MGRELKRVALSFKWPLNKVWQGYINEYARKKEECQKCKGSGYSEFAQELYKKWYDFEGETEPSERGGVRFKNAIQYNLNEDDIAALIKAGRLWDFTRVPKNEEQKKIVEQKIASGKNSWLPFDNGYIPTPQEVNIWAKKGFGHDGINCGVVISARCKMAEEDVLCPNCAGDGAIWSSETDRINYENWEPTQPPEGEGFQLWETTSEGSPQSPVFKTLDELCAYCEINCSTFGRQKTSKENWKKMLEKDCVHHKDGNIIFL